MSEMDDAASTSNNTSSCVGLDEEAQLQLQSHASATVFQPRRYQLEFFEKAKNENIIVYLETGSGKTQIAVLLIEEFAMRLGKPSKNVCVFLVPTVTLVNQQAEVIESQLTLKVGKYHGLANHSNKTHVQWEKELEEHEVLVMTPDILLRCLHHCFIKMEWVELLVFDECHHTQSDHPYAKIMRQFYKKDEVKRPRIFGMTASPIKGKGGSSKIVVAERIQSLERFLDAKVHTVKQRLELEMYVALPPVRIEYYENNASVDCGIKDKLKECMMKHFRLISNDDHTQNMENGKDESRKKVCKIYSDLIYSLTETGRWGTKQDILDLIEHREFLFSVSEVARMLLNDYITTLNEDGDQDGNDIAKSFLKDALLILESYVQDDINVITETRMYTEKVQALLNILSSYRNEQNIRAIIFVRRIVTARILTRIINDVHILKFWQCELLVGAHSGLKEMPRGKMTRVLEKFRSGMVSGKKFDDWFHGQVNLLVATNVAEEGLDIQMCSLVVRFDLPTGVCSFIQSRGRARMKKSSYIFLVERDNTQDELLVSDLIEGEIKMTSEVVDRTICFEQLEYEEEADYCVEETGATITAGCSVSRLNEYCSKLPKDDLFSPHPEFSFVGGPEGISCHINLPPSSPVRLVVGPASSSIINAKRSASLEACRQLHLKGGLDNYLLPSNNDLDLDDKTNTASDSKDHIGEELYEMLVPIALQGSWSMSETSVKLNAYLVNFVPLPPDREYTQFALFVGSSLPKEAETMCVELHLARSRTVRTELSPAGCIQLDDIQLRNALKFQEVFLKTMLEPKFFFETFVQLGGDQFFWGQRSSYLLLPAEVDGNRNIRIDWKGFIQDELFDPKQFSALGHHCHTICNSDTMFEIHSLKEENGNKKPNIYVKCNRRHRWISMKTIADVVEALIGAYLMDSGFNAALAFINWIGIDCKMDHHLIQKLCFCYKDVPSLKYDISIDKLQRLIGYNFKYKGLLVEAFIHPSYNDPSAGSYQRLEFLGDAALDYIITSYFYSVYPKLDPGSLTDMRSMTVNNEAFAAVALNHSLYTYIIHNSSGLLPTATRYAESVKASKKDAFEAKCPKVLGDIVESLAGAILVDTGFDIELLWSLMLKLLHPIETPERLYIQPDRELTELCSYHCLELEYAEQKIGRIYHISAKVSGKDFKGNCLSVVGKGANMNSKVATKNAAKDALAQLKVQHGFDYRNKREQLNGASDKMCPTLIGVDRGAKFIWTDKTSSGLLVDQETASNRPSVSPSLDCDMENASLDNNVSAQHSSIPTNESLNNNGAQNLSTSIPESLDNVAQHSISINESTDNSGTQYSSTATMELPPRTDVSEDSCARTSTVQPASTSTDVVEYNKASDTVQYEGCARSFLYEFCMKHGSRGPHWECIAEEGPSHFKSFKYKVVVELGEERVKCEGEAKPNKKLAMESAAHLARRLLQEHGLSSR